MGPTERPTPWLDSAPDGYHFAVRVDPDWRLVSEPGRVCRGTKDCPMPTVAAFARTHRTVTNRHGHRWWHYCPEHMYGRWIENDQIVWWQLVKDEVA